MRYLIIMKGHEPVLTEWFDAENNFNPDVEMVVYDFSECSYTTNGIDWHEITIDHL